MQQSLGELFDFHVANPDTIRLLLWEGLHYGDDPVPNESVRSKHYCDKISAIAHSQAMGMTDTSLDPRHVVLMLLSLAGWWFAVPQVPRMLVVDDTEPEALARHRAHIVEAARRIIGPIAQQGQTFCNGAALAERK